jgi:hypothetical protein
MADLDQLYEEIRRLPFGERLKLAERIVHDAAAEVPTQQAELQQQFQALAARWKAESAYTSSSSELVGHEAYRQIVALGQGAVPLLLREMEREPDHWDSALAELTGENPVGPEDAGRIDAIAQAWVRWGRSHRFGISP